MYVVHIQVWTVEGEIHVLEKYQDHNQLERRQAEVRRTYMYMYTYTSKLQNKMTSPRYASLDGRDGDGTEN